MKYESEDDALPTLYNFPRYPRPPAVSGIKIFKKFCFMVFIKSLGFIAQSKTN